MRLFGRHKRNSSRYLADTRTMFGRTRVYDVPAPDRPGSRLRVLDVEGTWQSGCYPDDGPRELAFHYHRSFAEILEMANVTRGHALVLGGGGFSFPAWLASQRPGIHTTAVEIDPDIISLARRLLALSQLSDAERGRLTISCNDAVSALRSLARDRRPAPFDVIVNDLFAAERPEQALMDEGGVRLVRSVLSPSGIYLANVVSALEGSRSHPLSRVLDALQASFAHTLVLPLGADQPRIPDNNVVVASDAAFDWMA